jgi:hypothetical protein
MLENTECATKKGQSNETSNIGYTRRRKTKQKQYVLDTTIRNVNKTWALLQTTGGKDEPNIVFMQKS